MNWLPPETAPKDGTPILGDFGWPWVNYAVWDECDEEWSIATWQACPIEGNSWIETDTKEESALKQWMPLPNPTGTARKSIMHCPQCGEIRGHDHQCTDQNQ